MHSAYVDIKKGRVIFIFFAEVVCYSGLLFPSKKRYVKNTVVFAQGDDPNDGFYLVLSGTLKVEVNGKFVRTLGAFCYLLFLSLTCINFPLRSIYFIPSKYWFYPVVLLEPSVGYYFDFLISRNCRIPPVQASRFGQISRNFQKKTPLFPISWNQEIKWVDDGFYLVNDKFVQTLGTNQQNCIPRASAARRKRTKAPPSLSPGSSPSRKVRTAKNHKNRHVCRM